MKIPTVDNILSTTLPNRITIFNDENLNLLILALKKINIVTYVRMSLVDASQEQKYQCGQVIKQLMNLSVLEYCDSLSGYIINYHNLTNAITKKISYYLINSLLCISPHIICIEGKTLPHQYKDLPIWLNLAYQESVGSHSKIKAEAKKIKSLPLNSNDCIKIIELIDNGYTQTDVLDKLNDGNRDNIKGKAIIRVFHAATTLLPEYKLRYHGDFLQNGYSFLGLRMLTKISTDI